MRAPTGIDVEPVTAWLARNLDGSVPPYRFDLIAAGGSNLTYAVTDAAGARYALRRPPVAGVLATAHDMDREWRIMSALEPTAVPVPPCLARCPDAAVTGAPFYVMGFVDGLVLREAETAATFTADEAERATDSLIDAQIGFHTVDLEAVGLADLGRHTDYVARQLKRWRTQYERSQTRTLPLLEDLHDRLARRIPAEQGRPGLAHGDYRFDNCVLGADRAVIAVLDWELCTIGDPVADFAWSLMYWTDPGDEESFLPSSPTLASQFPRRAEVAERYAARSGYDLSDLRYYIAFSWWKMACIVEGVYGRRLRGASGGAPHGEVAAIAARVERFLQMADTAERVV